MSLNRLSFPLIFGLLCLTSCTEQTPPKAPSTPKTSTSTTIESRINIAPTDAPMIMSSIIETGQTGIGQLTLKETPTGVIVKIQASGIPEGWHGVHFHIKGDCSDPAFKNSGGHINHGGHEHGLRNPNGPDNADLPNIYADANGNVNVELITTRVALTPNIPGRANLLDEDGSALVIHANRDDQVTQPIGGAGPRIACSSINR